MGVRDPLESLPLSQPFAQLVGDRIRLAIDIDENDTGVVEGRDDFEMVGDAEPAAPWPMIF